jgi:hypothetical protein
MGVEDDRRCREGREGRLCGGRREGFLLTSNRLSTKEQRAKKPQSQNKNKIKIK